MGPVLMTSYLFVFPIEVADVLKVGKTLIDGLFGAWLNLIFNERDMQRDTLLVEKLCSRFGIHVQNDFDTKTA